MMLLSFGIADLLQLRLDTPPALSDDIVSLFCLVMGILGLIDFLDRRRAILIWEDRIAIKSFFRTREILKKDIRSYGIEDYEMDHFGKGERIRIFGKTKSIKVFSTQFENLDPVKTFLKGKKKLKPDIAFRRERIAFY